MRFACALAMVLGLSLPTAATASQQGDPTGSANSAGQAPTSPAAPAETVPAQNPPSQSQPPQKPSAESAPAEQPPPETTPAPSNPQTPAAVKKEPVGVARKKTAAGSTGGTRKRRKRVPSAPNGAPRKIVVREGGAREPAAQIAPGMTPAEATRQRQNAERLLGSADDQLKNLAGRTLDARQQEEVGQIRNYMAGARSALKEGDVRRAGTLAQKAQLLLDDLGRR